MELDGASLLETHECVHHTALVPFIVSEGKKESEALGGRGALHIMGSGDLSAMGDLRLNEYG